MHVAYGLFILISISACRNEIKTPVVSEDTAVVLMDGDGDGFYSDEDCDDSNATTYPDAPEICDGIDNNCNQEVDEGVLSTFFEDKDGDGFGNADVSVESCVANEGTVPNSNDCDDQNPDVYPAAVELCDGLDNDCDEEVDEEVTGTWFQDLDGDGFGNIDVSIQGCSADGFIETAGDCNDDDPLISPNMDELCDEVDNNCDGQIDEGLLILAYVDADEDGYGDDFNPVEICELELGYTTTPGDCDDIDFDIKPTAVEICDGVDNNCDGNTDDGTAVGAVEWYRDADMDGYGDPSDIQTQCDQPTGFVSNNLDCSPTNNAQFPGAPEFCNGADDDCDGTIDESGSIGASTYYDDVDGDGFGNNSTAVQSCIQPSGAVTNNLDCDDTDPTVYLGATELCDGQINACGTLLSFVEIDDDNDGYVDCTIDSAGWDGVGSVVGGDDCDDTNGDIYPNAPELCDGFANVCGQSLPTDELDDDGDGYVECSILFPWAGVVGGEDCDDSNGNIYPNAPEICDGIANVCGQSLPIDELDDDGDGYVECDIDSSGWQGSVSIVGGLDCVDSDVYTHPDIAFNEIDSELCMTDVDGDGYGDLTATVSVPGTDCDDGDAGVNPGQGNCPEGYSCKDILDSGNSQGSGTYMIDPDGFGQGVAPFEVYCDMTPGDAGWTEIPYANDLPFRQHYSNGDAWRWLSNDFTFDLTTAQISAIQDVSVEGKQQYVGRCNHVIHHFYISGSNYAYAFGFEMFDGSILGSGISFAALPEVSVLQDGCATNGGEGGSLSSATIFSFNTVSVPVVNVRCRDCGDSGEMFGSPLTNNSAWLR